jgi:hypothetical protein
MKIEKKMSEPTRELYMEREREAPDMQPIFGNHTSSYLRHTSIPDFGILLETPGTPSFIEIPASFSELRTRN